MQIADFFEEINTILTYSQTCIIIDISNSACRRFWLWLVLCMIVVCVILLFKLISREIAKIKQINLYEKKLANKAKVADETTMNQVRWQTDPSAAEITQQDLAEQIRSTLQSKK